MKIHGELIDFVNLRAESYAEDSRMPTAVPLSSHSPVSCFPHPSPSISSLFSLFSPFIHPPLCSLPSDLRNRLGGRLEKRPDHQQVKLPGASNRDRWAFLCSIILAPFIPLSQCSPSLTRSLPSLSQPVTPSSAMFSPLFSLFYNIDTGKVEDLTGKGSTPTPYLLSTFLRAIWFGETAPKTDQK
jgi:hypothetical protein